jgi:hypothetical protein
MGTSDATRRDVTAGLVDGRAVRRCAGGPGLSARPGADGDGDGDGDGEVDIVESRSRGVAESMRGGGIR